MQWTIKRKLFLGFGLAAIMMAGCTFIARWAQVRAQATQDQITKTYGMLNDIQYLESYVRGVTVVQRAYLISGDEKAVAGIPAMRQDAAVVTNRVTAAVADNPALKEAFGGYLIYVVQRRNFVNKLNAARKDQGFDAAKALFSTGEDDRLKDQIEGQFALMKTTAKAQLSTQEADNTKLQQQIAWVEMLTVVLALALLTGIAIALSKSITKNVEIAVGMVSAMAQKDMSGADMDPASDDELAEAIQAINQMKQAMAEALSEVAKSSSQVAAAGTEMAASTREMSNATHDEQQKITMFASSLAEMNATVKDVANHAENASNAATEAVETATSGRAVVEQTRAAMNKISDTVKAASGDITTLGAVTGSIGEVVRIIQEIAEQTNLLALNAAIEAARAGEQGKGFAVVAQEVRQLAERTATFTKEIADKIESVQQGANRAVQSMQQGEAVVNEGVEQFNQVSTALDAILQRIETAQQGIAMIATATTEQSIATAGLTENIHDISSEVDQTAQQVDQMATACAELANLASVLQQVVDGFRLPVEIQSGRQSRKPTVYRRAA